jgi:hypothetical protein
MGDFVGFMYMTYRFESCPDYKTLHNRFLFLPCGYERTVGFLNKDVYEQKKICIFKIKKNKIKMSDNKSTGGIGIGMILFLIFMTLKLTGNIDWSWWWVTAPLWIPILLVVFIIGLTVFLYWLKR